MAQQVKVLLIDDIDGSEAAETVKFGLDGREYEIDLTEAHAAELREMLARYVSVARRLGKAGTPYKRTTVAPQRDTKAIRAWAHANGWENLSDRGRIPEEVMKAYEARDKKADEGALKGAPKVEFSEEPAGEEPPKRTRSRKKAEPANA